MRTRRRLSKRVTLALLFLLVFIISTLVADTSITTKVAALGLAGVLILLVESVVSNGANLLRVTRQTAPLQEMRDTSRRIAGTVGRMAPVLRNLEAEKRPMPPTEVHAHHGAKSDSLKERHVPSPTRPNPGKGAAATELVNLRIQYGRGATPPPTTQEGWTLRDRLAQRRTVLTVGRAPHLGLDASFVDPSATLDEFRIQNVSCVLLDRATVNEGVWSGIESAAGYGLLRRLQGLVSQARDAGIPFYVLEGRVPTDVSTSAIRDLADAVFPLDVAAIAPDGATQSAHFMKLQSIGQKRKEATEVD